MTIITPTHDFGVVRTIFESSWSGPWILGPKNDGRDGKHRDLNTLPKGLEGNPSDSSQDILADAEESWSQYKSRSKVSKKEDQRVIDD